LRVALESVLGMPAEEIDAVILGLAPLDASMLADEVERLLDDLDSGCRMFEGELKLPNKVGNVVDSHYKTMDSITSELEAGKITLDQYNKKAHEAISNNFREAYSLGRGKVLDAGDEEYIRRAVDQELVYARKFGEDVSTGNIRMPRERRARMYGDTCEGIAWNGKVESLPDNVRIYWKLGQAEHCIDCIVLANSSPFTKRNLPTTPRAGGTRCKSNCRCRLEVRKGRMTAAEREEVGEYSLHRGESLAEMLSPSEPPKGLRLPRTDRVVEGVMSEREYIDELRHRIDTNRRKVALAKTEKARKQAIVARKQANAELIEFLEKEGIWDVPLWSVDEVISEAHIGARAEADIFRHGIDGESLEMMSEREVAALVRRYEKEIGEAYEDLEPYVKPKATKKTEAENVKTINTKQVLIDSTLESGEVVLTADSLADTMRLAARALAYARGRAVQVGPFSDQLLRRVYAWMKGSPGDVAAVLEELSRGDIGFLAVPVEMKGGK